MRLQLLLLLILARVLLTLLCRILHQLHWRGRHLLLLLRHLWHRRLRLWRLKSRLIRLRLLLLHGLVIYLRLDELRELNGDLRHGSGLEYCVRDRLDWIDWDGRRTAHPAGCFGPCLALAL